MSIHAPSTGTRPRRGAVISHRPTRAEHRRATEARRIESLAGIDPAVAIASAEIHRWVQLLAAPFVTSAAFFGLALGTGTEWPMAPAVLLGPTLMIVAYIYLMLSGDTNDAGRTESTS